MARKRTIQGKEPVFEMEATQEGTSIFDYLSIWYGAPKIGKSTLLSKFPGTYFLVTEPGYKFLTIRKSKIDNWADFIAFIKKVEHSKKFVASVKMWVIDPIDKLAKFCMTHVCDKRGIDHPADQEWGKGWEAFRDEFAEWMLRLCAVGPGVAAISHVKEREVITRTMVLTKETPAMPKTCYTILNDLADIVAKIGYEPKVRGKKNKQRRCLFLEGTETIEAGNRTGSLLPPILPFNTEQEVVDKIMKSFEQKGGHLKKKKKKRRV